MSSGDQTHRLGNGKGFLAGFEKIAYRFNIWLNENSNHIHPEMGGLR